MPTGSPVRLVCFLGALRMLVMAFKKQEKWVVFCDAVLSVDEMKNVGITVFCLYSFRASRVAAKRASSCLMRLTGGLRELYKNVEQSQRCSLSLHGLLFVCVSVCLFLCLSSVSVCLSVYLITHIFHLNQIFTS